MCIGKQPDPPTNPANYAPEDGHKQFSVTKTDNETGETETIQAPQGETKKALRNKPASTMIRI
jgi:hypothetical protein